MIRLIYILLSVLIFISSIFQHDSVLNKNEYIFYAIFVVFSLATIFINRFRYPKKYIILGIIYIVICCILAKISRYETSTDYFFIGLLFTILPFIHFLISYNFSFSDRNIIRFFNILTNIILIINFIAIIETFIIRNVTTRAGMIGSSVFWFQYVVSVNSQIIILCIALKKITKKKRYVYQIIFLAISSILSIQLKTYISLIVIAFGYTIIYNRRNITAKIFIISTVCLLSIFTLIQIPKVEEKISNYVSYYVTNTEGIARPALYVASVEIAKESFPFGTGQGTFGSVPTNFYDSQVYIDYELINIWGLSNEHSVNFKQDTHWASILGENGVLGTILYLMLFLYPCFSVYKYKNIYKEYFFIIAVGFFVLCIESIVLNLISRLVFVILNFGVSGLIIRRVNNQQVLYK